MGIDDVRRLPLIRRDLELTGKFAWRGPAKVDVYLDDAARVVYQVDERTRRFRSCNLDGSEYGAWQSF